MLSRWSESIAARWMAIALLSGCSSDETSPTPIDTSGNGGTSNAGGDGNAVGGSSSDMVGTGGDAPPSFATDIWPTLTMKCGTSSCHGNDSFFPQHAHSDIEFAYEQAQPIADSIAGRVSGELMPIMPLFCGQGPGSGDCLSLAEVDLISTWAQAGAPY